ncbi:hypothetical protein SELMODRAFT_416464 [Selaginella moellendorffii]|uniref:Purple acid phosphatase C-terminal domain-containing protein n=1 Tax=Selaginella moellendorffii TaxID=88036 RepID=D8RZD1_SELML|nr:hypothetical protein SELMODRAFT_416464 [Selaginella moellendorffii]
MLPLHPITSALGRDKSTWSSGYRTSEAIPFVSYEVADHIALHKIPLFSAASTLSLSRGDVWSVAILIFVLSTVGWRDPGQIHTGSMKDLLPNTRYSYRVGHKLLDNLVVMSPIKYFKSVKTGCHIWRSGKADTITKERDDIDIIFHIGDLSYATGYISQWDQFTEQIEGMTSRVPYMTARYSTDYGLFHFCIADSEHDWREKSGQYKWIEECLPSADREKQPWLIRVLGYSMWYLASENATAEPFSRESLQFVAKEVYISNEANVYSGKFNETIRVVAGGAGGSLTPFLSPTPPWSVKRDYDYGYSKMTYCCSSTRRAWTAKFTIRNSKTCSAATPKFY